MQHAKDIELIELAADRLDAGRRGTILDHVRQCSRCREKLEDVRRTWDILGAWEVQAPDRGERGVPASAPASESQTVRRPVVRLWVGMALRFAAAIAIAVLGGYLGGRWSVSRGPAAYEVEPPAYLSALGLEVGESLSSLVLDDEPLPVEEGRT